MFGLLEHHNKYVLEKEQKLIRNLHLEGTSYSNFKRSYRNNEIENASDKIYRNINESSLTKDSKISKEDSLLKNSIHIKSINNNSNGFNKIETFKEGVNTNNNVEDKINRNNNNNNNKNTRNFNKLKTNKIDSSINIVSLPKIPRHKKIPKYKQNNHKKLQNDIKTNISNNESLFKKLFDEQNEIIDNYKKSANLLIKERDRYISETKMLNDKIIKSRNQQMNNFQKKNYSLVLNSIIDKKINNLINTKIKENDCFNNNKITNLLTPIKNTNNKSIKNNLLINTDKSIMNNNMFSAKSYLTFKDKTYGNIYNNIDNINNSKISSISSSFNKKDDIINDNNNEKDKDFPFLKISSKLVEIKDVNSDNNDNKDKEFMIDSLYKTWKKDFKKLNTSSNKINNKKYILNSKNNNTNLNNSLNKISNLSKLNTLKYINSSNKKINDLVNASNNTINPIYNKDIKFNTK